MRLLARTTALTLGALLISSSGAFAAATALQPVQEVKDASTWQQWIAFVLMIVISIIVAFKNPKRTHQN
ncbi:MAG: hypothetical protein H6817_10220 [Phycisphaerales bacterium]|nr:hypothetical protein [Phycisphaerales bacterium]